VQDVALAQYMTEPSLNELQPASAASAARSSDRFNNRFMVKNPLADERRVILGFEWLGVLLRRLDRLAGVLVDPSL